MPREIGDIIVYRGRPGHVAMVYDANTIIHAQMKGDFHKDPYMTEKSGTMSYADDGADVFSPPWPATGTFKAAHQAELQRVADQIAASATYGAYRAVRLWAGDSSFGPKAWTRLYKYKTRQKELLIGGKKFVTTVTCSEAVILCYQLTFEDSEAPFFIKLDAAHAMPNTLRAWLKTNW
jgi:hypothetical protein